MENQFDAMASVRDLRAQIAKSMSADLAKTFPTPGSPTSGLVAYDLEAPAKILYPVLTPLRNATPRVGAGTGLQANWRAITGINTANLAGGISAGHRNATLTTTTQDYFAAYRGLGFDDNIAWENEYAAQGFDSPRTRMVESLLRSTMLYEELVILGGNGTTGLGTTPTPGTPVDTSADGGTIPFNTVVSIICVALTLEGFKAASVTGGIFAAVSRTNADSSVDNYGGGAAKKSAANSVTTANDANSAHTVKTVLPTAVPGAAGYAWFWGTAGNETLGAITTINSVKVTTAAGAGTQTATSLGTADNSVNGLIFDGLIPLAVKSGSNAYVRALANGAAGVGTTLTADNAGGIVEIEVALKYFWDTLRLSPTAIWISAQEQKNIGAKMLTTSSGVNSAFRFVIDQKQGNLQGGSMVRSYLNKYAMDGAQEIPFKLHPNMPAGTMLFDTETLPYPLSNVSNVRQIRTRREYHAIEWPIRTRQWEHGVYVDEVLQHYFPPSLGIIYNIADG